MAREETTVDLDVSVDDDAMNDIEEDVMELMKLQMARVLPRR